MTISDKEKLARIKLNAFTYLRTDWAERMIDVFGSAEDVLKQSAATLAQQGGISTGTAADLLRDAHALNAEEEVELTRNAGGEILFLGEDGYPAKLAEIKDPPFVLYVRGQMKETGPRVSMVGTRMITPYGRRCCNKFASEISQAGCIVVSGLARGVDSACHAAAVANKKPTWAVVGTGIGRCYPAENRALASAILEHGGCIISELPFNKPPHAFHFPRRNRIISALGSVVVIIEGKERSGALITAKLAAEQGKDILAVPGNIDSIQSGGTNKLIRDGAHALLDTKDIIDMIPFEERFGLDTDFLQEDNKKEFDNLTEVEKRYLSVVGSEEVTVDEIIENLGVSVQEASTVLFDMEIKGVLTCIDGKYSKNKF
ncbi:DNA processing protein [Elusimicrobium simillimum]|uniref:DNA-processing protein DprA n=1 Tax=Elusimicrobium simillimum TaxID=3143438 RepID=UPI003C6FAE3F